MKKVVVGIVALVILVTSFVMGVFASETYWTDKVRQDQKEELRELPLNSKIGYTIFDRDNSNDYYNMDFIITRVK